MQTGGSAERSAPVSKLVTPQGGGGQTPPHRGPPSWGKLRPEFPSLSLSEDSLFLPSGHRLRVVPPSAKQVPLCRTDHKMTFPGRVGPRTICPQLPKPPVATFMLTTALGGRGSVYVHSTVGQAETYSPEKAQREPGEHRGLGKVELKGQGL